MRHLLFCIQERSRWSRDIVVANLLESQLRSLDLKVTTTTTPTRKTTPCLTRKTSLRLWDTSLRSSISTAETDPDLTPMILDIYGNTPRQAHDPRYLRRTTIISLWSSISTAHDMICPRSSISTAHTHISLRSSISMALKHYKPSIFDIQGTTNRQPAILDIHGRNSNPSQRDDKRRRNTEKPCRVNTIIVITIIARQKTNSSSLL